ATLRMDGSPRISGIEVEFEDDGLYLGSMAGALKALDLRRDPRLALHSPTEDPPDADPSQWLGEAKLSGRAHEMTNPPQADQPHRFRVEISEVVLTYIDDSAEHLVIESWHPGRGLEQSLRK
ncbi:MAG: pyridoxamine 5'-phosphate oxidase family protein, partial [Candidatus Dormibacteraceae bacterium]